MALIYRDRVLETSTTTGTGTYTLAGAVTGFQAFSAVGNANTCYYAAWEVDGSGNPSGGWEAGLGTYTLSGTTLARTTVLKSSNSDAAVNWSAGTRRIALVVNADSIGFTREIYIDAGAMVAQTTSGAATGTFESSTNDIMNDCFDFDTGADENVQFKIALPGQYANGTIKAKFYWTAASGSGTVKFYIQAGALSNDDAIDTALGTAVGVEDTLITANDVHVSDATAAVTIAGTPATDDMIYFRVYRDVSEDTLGVDARLLGVKIQYTDAATAQSAW